MPEGFWQKVAISSEKLINLPVLRIAKADILILIGK
jgi:hypothetical protein